MDDINKPSKNNLIEFNHSQFTESPDLYMQQTFKSWFDVVVSADLSGLECVEIHSESLNDIGLKEQQLFWESNNRLKLPMEKAIRDAENSEKLTRLYQDLVIAILKIKPPKVSFWNGFKNMFKLLFSLKESAFHIWLDDYPSNKNQIQHIIEEINAYKRKLIRDSALFLKDKSDLDTHVNMLENSYDFIGFLATKTRQEVTQNQTLSTDNIQIIQNDLIPIMHHRSLELQQQLLIARQTKMTMELFVHQNKATVKAIQQTINSAISTIDITTSLFMLEQASNSTDNKASRKLNKQKMTRSSKAHKLKQVRTMIDQTLNQMEQIKSESNSDS